MESGQRGADGAKAEDASLAAMGSVSKTGGQQTYSQAKEQEKNPVVDSEGKLRFEVEGRDPDDHEFGYLKHQRAERLAFRWKDMSRWQHKRMVLSLVLVIGIAIVFLAATCAHVYTSNRSVDAAWEHYMGQEAIEKNDKRLADLDAAGRTANAQHVECAVYLAQVRSIDMASSSYQVTVVVGYRWQGGDSLDFSEAGTVNFYRGVVNQTAVMDESHEGGQNYQLVRYAVTVTKSYDTTCFPLGTHLMRLYLEPGQSIDKIVLDPVEGESTFNRDMEVSGFNLTNYGVHRVIYEFDSDLLNPSTDELAGDGNYKSEVLAAFMMERADVGMYFECFIALFGTLAWIILCLYICTYRRIDPLTMISAAFFGAVSNVLAGAAKVPLSLSFGLLIYGNLFGIGLIIAGTAIVISINTLRKDIGSRAFAHYYGRIMMKTFIVIAVAGNIALPLCAVL